MCKACDERDAADVEDFTLAFLDLAKELGLPKRLAALALARAAGVLAAESGLPGVPFSEMMRGRVERDQRAIGRD